MKSSRDDSFWINRARQQVEQAKQASRGESSTGSGSSIAAHTPEKLTGYKLLHELARGAQGVVYVARQESTKRLVAIKMVRDGPFISAQDRVRFEREVQILASLNHPHIVTIHDSGATSGCLYLVMDLIEGATLDEHVRQLHASATIESAAEQKTLIRTTLALFVKVCDAVHAAHLRGVIHRDLKPSNIRINESGEPLVLDFGLAKSVATPPGESGGPATVTQTGQFVGTANYASPEQIESHSEVDLRSDVYALGVILYELLTGRWPYESSGAMHRAIEAILNQEPIRPRLAKPTLDDEIETVLLKCLAKQPARRYQSAGDLARDLRRYLAGEPIEAKRDSGWYVLSKNLRRHKLVVGFSVVLVLLLAGATVGLAILNEQQRRAHVRATRHYQQVQSLAHTVLFDLDDHIRPLAGATPARHFLVQTGLEYLANLEREAGDDWDTLCNLTNAYLKIGDVLGGLDANNLGDTAGARESYEKALHFAEVLHASNPQHPQARNYLAQSHVRIGDLHFKSGRLDEADRAYQDGLALAKTLPERPRTHAHLLSLCETKVGDVLVREGKLDKALAQFERALAISDRLMNVDSSDYRARNDRAVHLYKIGRTLGIKGDRDASLERYREVLLMRRELRDENVMSGDDRFALGHILVDVADALVARGDIDEGLERYFEARDSAELLAAADPKNVKVRLELALIHERIGGCRVEQNRLEEALVHYEESLALRRHVVDSDPEDARARRELAVAHEKVGNVFADAKRLDDALKHYETALAFREGLLATGTTSSEARRDVAVSHFKISGIHAEAAENASHTLAERLEHWRSARKQSVRSLEIVTAMKRDGVLTPGDSGIPKLLTDNIEACDSAIAELAREAKRSDSSSD